MAKQAPQAGQEIGSNVTAELVGDVLVLRVNTATRLGNSKSGKSQIIATTSGNVKVTTPKGEVVVGLNIYQKA